MTTTSDRHAAYGQQMAKHFRLSHAPTRVIRPPSGAQIAMTRLVSTVGLPERTASIPAEKAFVVSVHLTPASSRGCDIWVEDRHRRIADWPAGGIGIYDLESNPRTRNAGPVDWIHYHVPRSTLDTFASDAGRAPVATLQCTYGTVDTVLHRMTQMLLPSLDAEATPSELFLDYFRLLFCSHVVQKYDPSFGAMKTHRGGLAPWQQRRVTELLREHLDGSVRLAMLAKDCGLSVSHFARSFRRSFGTSAHRYLVQQRVEKAKELLSRSTWPLTEIAFQTGFADQAAFTRTFRAVVGVPPGQWRRATVHRRPSNVSMGLNSVLAEALVPI
jgi:AraC family transcriptional regulator